MTTVQPKDFPLIAENPIDGVYGLEGLFTREWCDALISLAESSGKWTTKRHENYPTHDMTLLSLSPGMNQQYSAYLTETLVPYFAKLYHTELEDGVTLAYETFIAKYSPDQQSLLGLHHDESVVTTLVTLNDDFEGGGTFFLDQQATLKPSVGTVSSHPGQLTHYHGAKPTTRGTRYILVTFINEPEAL